jgi:hypothetical protein
MDLLRKAMLAKILNIHKSSGLSVAVNTTRGALPAPSPVLTIKPFS